MRGFTYIWKFKATYYNTVEETVSTKKIETCSESMEFCYHQAITLACSDDYLPSYSMLVKIELIKNDLYTDLRWKYKKPENED